MIDTCGVLKSHGLSELYVVDIQNVAQRILPYRKSAAIPRFIQPPLSHHRIGEQKIHVCFGKLRLFSLLAQPHDGPRPVDIVRLPRICVIRHRILQFLLLPVCRHIRLGHMNTCHADLRGHQETELQPCLAEVLLDSVLEIKSNIRHVHILGCIPFHIVFLPRFPPRIVKSGAVYLPHPAHRLIIRRQLFHIQTAVLPGPCGKADRHCLQQNVLRVQRIEDRPLRVLLPCFLHTRNDILQTVLPVQIHLFPEPERQVDHHGHTVYFIFLRHPHPLDDILVQNAVVQIGLQYAVQLPEHPLVGILFDIHLIHDDHIRHIPRKQTRVQVSQRVLPADRIVTVHPRLIPHKHIRVFFLEKLSSIADPAVLLQTVHRQFLRRSGGKRLIIVHLHHVIAAEHHAECPVVKYLQGARAALGIPERGHLPVRNLLDHRTAPYVTVQPRAASHVQNLLVFSVSQRHHETAGAVAR